MCVFKNIFRANERFSDWSSEAGAATEMLRYKRVANGNIYFANSSCSILRNLYSDLEIDPSVQI